MQNNDSLFGVIRGNVLLKNTELFNTQYNHNYKRRLAVSNQCIIYKVLAMFNEECNKYLGDEFMIEPQEDNLMITIERGQDHHINIVNNAEITLSFADINILKNGVFFEFKFANDLELGFYTKVLTGWSINASDFPSKNQENCQINFNGYRYLITKILMNIFETLIDTSPKYVEEEKEDPDTNQKFAQMFGQKAIASQINNTDTNKEESIFAFQKDIFSV